MEKHVPNLISALWAFGFLAAVLAAGRLVRPDRKSEAARSGFNSGERNDESPWIRVSARYHLILAATAAFFLGALLLYPAAASFREWLEEGKGLTALLAIGVFMGTLSVALSHAWMKGDLNWIVEPGSSPDNKADGGNSRERVS